MTGFLFDDVRRAAYDFVHEVHEGLRPDDGSRPAGPAPEAPPVPPAVHAAATRAAQIAWAEAVAAAEARDHSALRELRTVVARQDAELRQFASEVAALREDRDAARRDAASARAAQAKAEGIAAGLREALGRDGGGAPAPTP